MIFKGAIFDMDGVVTTTVPLHFKAWKRMFEEYGKKFTFADYERYVDGIPRADGARAILKDLPEDKLKEAADKKQAYFLEILNKEPIPVYPTVERAARVLGALNRRRRYLEELEDKTLDTA